MIRKNRFGVARCGLICTLLLGVLPLSGRTQTNERPVIYTNKTVFHLPVRIDDRHRAGLREIRLYVKNGAADWARQETGQPDVKHFSYRVPQDGEYWFSVVTVDQAGAVSPADISREPPGLRVMVDTNPPIVDLRAAVGIDGKPCLKCVLQDANVDYQSLKLSYQTIDGREQQLMQDPSSPGVFPVTNPEVWGRMVRVEAKDRCGNLTQREFPMQNPIAQAAPPAFPPSSPALPLPATPTENVALKTNVPPLSQPDLPPALPVPPSVNPLQDVPPLMTPPTQELTSTPALTPPTSHEVSSAPNFNIPTDPALTQVVATQTVPSYGTPKTTRLADASRRLLSTTRAALEYRIDDVGPSGVSKVEVYMTGDEGQTWRRLQEDFDRRSPAEVNLPGEGKFGLRLAVTNGNGFGGTPPKAGDEPTTWVEVDTTSPFVQLRNIDPLAKGGNLTICWTANDSNLATEPVSLYFRTRRDGPWQVMAVNLPNTGIYQWAFPRQQGAQFFIRVEVRDEAGNVARAETSEPITLDLSEPRGSVVGVTAINGVPTP